MSNRELTWRPSELCAALAGIGFVGLVMAVLTHAPALLALVAPELCWLALDRRAPQVRRLTYDFSSGPERCYEYEELLGTVQVEPVGPRIQVAATCYAAGGHRVSHQEPLESTGGWSWRIPASPWGRRSPAVVRLRARSGLGLWMADQLIGWPQTTIIPGTGSVTRAPSGPRLRRLVGGRPARWAGSGVEAVGVEPATGGGPIRRVNWRATLRRGSVHVTTYSAESAQDVVIVVDAIVHAGEPGRTTVDRAVRGAAELVHAYSAAGDRVGLVTVDPALAWTSPGVGARHVTELLDRLVEVGKLLSVVPPDLGRIPPVALPHGCLVIVLTPLLTEDSVGIAADLRRRGYAVVVVDVLLGQPPLEEDDPFYRTALALWRLDREATRAALVDKGVLVHHWPEGAALGESLTQALVGHQTHRHGQEASA